MCCGKKAVNAEENDPFMMANAQLCLASSTGDNDGVVKAVQMGAEVNAPQTFAKSIKNAVPTGDYPLHLAAEAGHVETVALLFFTEGQSANPDYRNLLGSTALHRATSYSHADVVRELLEHGADVNATNKVGSTALHIAATCGNTTVAKILLEHGAYSHLNTANKVGMTPLDCARKNSMKDLLRSYVKEDSKRGRK